MKKLGRRIARLGATFSAAAALLAFGPTGEASAAALAAGPYLIFNNVTGKCVDLPNYGGGTVGGSVYQYTCNGTSGDNQLFYFDYQGVIGGYAQYTIRNAKDGLCLDVPNYGPVSAGTVVTEYWCRPTGDNQLYWLYQRPDGHHWLVNQASGLCLDVDGVRTGGNDAKLTLYYCSDSDDHHWSLYAG